MDFETLFAQTRWQILSLLADTPLSPLEIAERLHATISHVSQQLKFLEAMGIVKKEKVSNRDRGKPRMIFSLARDYAHLSLLVKGFSGKKLLSLSDHHKTILRIWFLENIGLHRRLERFYWEMEEHLPEIKAMLVDVIGNIVVVVEDQEKMRGRLSASLKKYSKEGLSCVVVNEKQFSRSYSIEGFSVFFGNIIKDTKEVK